MALPKEPHKKARTARASPKVKIKTPTKTQSRPKPLIPKSKTAEPLAPDKQPGSSRGRLSIRIRGRMKTQQGSVSHTNTASTSKGYYAGAAPSLDSSVRQYQTVRIKDRHNSGHNRLPLTHEELILLLDKHNIKLDPDQIDKLVKAFQGSKKGGSTAEELKAIGDMKGMSASDRRKLALALTGEAKKPPMEGFAQGSSNLFSSLTLGASHILLILVLILMMWIVLQFFPMM